MKLSKYRPTPAPVIALIALFVALGGVGVAANGGNFILGQSNNAGNTTALSSGVTTGPTLALTNTGNKPAARFSANSGVAPFSVGSAAKVAGLNADKLDGFDSSYFLPGSAVRQIGPVTVAAGSPAQPSALSAGGLG
jgi:hypothetical protein